MHFMKMGLSSKISRTRLLIDKIINILIFHEPSWDYYIVILKLLFNKGWVKRRVVNLYLLFNLVYSIMLWIFYRKLHLNLYIYWSTIEYSSTLFSISNRISFKRYIWCLYKLVLLGMPYVTTFSIFHVYNSECVSFTF